MQYCSNAVTRVAYKIYLFLFLLAWLILVHKMMTAIGNRDIVNAVFYTFASFFWLASCAGFGILTVYVHRKFQLLPEGIVVAYWRNSPRMILWSEVSEVAVCHIHRSRNRNGVHAIRLAVGEAFKSGEDPYGLWQMFFEFSLKYHKHIIIIEHTEELEAEFARACPISITNLLI